MADIFFKEDMKRIFHRRKILFLGDSIMRNIYQDFIYMIEKGDLTPHYLLRKKGEQIPSFVGDCLLYGTGILTAGRSYEEIRHYEKLREGSVSISATFCFLTRCYSRNLDDFIHNYGRKHGPPDLILVLSALWDINRWGPEGITDYRTNCRRLLSLVSREFPSSTQLIWLTSPPISVEIRGGVLVKGMEFTERSMRFNVLEGNHMVSHMSAAFGYDVVDLHYWMTHLICKRMSDGIHWSSEAVRLQVNIIATHFCLSRNIPLPGRCGVGRSLRTVIQIAEAADIDNGEIVWDTRREDERNVQPPSKRLKRGSNGYDLRNVLNSM